MKTKFPKNSLVGLALCGLLLCAALPSLHAQHRFTRLHSFGATNLAMFAPNRLIEGSDGAFYGITWWGASGEASAVVRLAKDGSDYTVLRSGISFSPFALLEGRDGLLYGVGAGGAVFKLNRDGTGYAVLRDLAGGIEAGYVLIEGRDGILYGTGARNGHDVVFKLNKNGSVFTLVYELDATGMDGRALISLLEGSDGVLYGTALNGGGPGDWGTIFKVNKNGGDFTVLHRLDRNAGEEAFPGSLLEGSDGVLYGTTATDQASVFKVNKNGTGFATLCHLPECGTDNPPLLVEGPDGALYGFTDECGSADEGTAFKLNKDGTGYTLLHEFSYTNAGGGWVMAGPVLASDGALYGTTGTGGSADQGTLFKLNPDGTGYQVLTSFQGNVSINDGQYPRGVIQGSDGILYGVTYSGGTSNAGTVFKVNPDGTGYQLFHNFQGNNDGAAPLAPLLEGSDGVLYGTTPDGGTAKFGTIFRLNKDGSGYGVLHHFQGGPLDGAGPGTSLLEGTDGFLYGTTSRGGTSDAGTVFKLNPISMTVELLHQHGTDDVPLLEASDGFLYGTSLGSVFKLRKDGTAFTVVYDFQGSGPVGLLESSDGALYGVARGSRAVFRLNKDGTGYTQLYELDYVLHGTPNGPLLEGHDGVLYGTTEEGGAGADNFGTVFRVGKDGSAFSILRCFREEDGSYIKGLTEGSDGALYGVTEEFSEFGHCTLFRLEVAPVLYNPMWSNNVFSFQFNAGANVVYQPQFKSSLADSNWTALPSITGQRGVVTVTDTNLPAPPRFYRVVIP